MTIELGSERDSWPRQDVVRELEELARTANAQVTKQIFCVRDKPTPNFFIGKGKVEEIAFLSCQEDIDTVIFSHDLSGTQQRNLEEIIGKKTIDRTQLILDIFAKHARSPEGNMQVELAQLEYLLPRLVGKGIMLSRLGGGIGTRGPGEQKLEVDRRRIRKRINKLKDDLKRVSSHRLTLRKKRKENAIPSVALVGYTNAGKSTLLNALTSAGQVVCDSLFTTLDPLTKSLKLDKGGNIVISDTVGFLHNLPLHLIEAFKATLEEVVESDLLIHVLDVSNPRVQEHNQAVWDVLRKLHCENKPVIPALNKIDLLEDKAWLGWLQQRFPNSVSISAKRGDNLAQLIRSLEDFFQPQRMEIKLTLPLSRMDLVDLLYRQAKVKEIEYGTKTIKIIAILNKLFLYNLLKNKEVKIIN